jgi:hypothetical protein
MITLLIFLAVLSVLVISHEFGHFITARKNGIAVEEFGFGFPPRVVGVQRLTKTNADGSLSLTLEGRTVTTKTIPETGLTAAKIRDALTTAAMIFIHPGDVAVTGNIGLIYT